jgi:hypothetical protein
MITIDIEDDVREYYVLENTVDDVTLKNVTVLQNQSAFNILISVNGKRLIVEHNKNIVFDTATDILFRKGANGSSVVVSIM